MSILQSVGSDSDFWATKDGFAFEFLKGVSSPAQSVTARNLQTGSSSVALNLAEGSEGVSDQNRRRYYRISMASLRESQAILDLLTESEST